MTRKIIITIFAVLIFSFIGKSNLAMASYASTKELNSKSAATADLLNLTQSKNILTTKPQYRLIDQLQQISKYSSQAHYLTFASSKLQIIRDAALTLFGPGQVDLAKPIVVMGSLKDASSGEAIANMTVTFSTGGFYLGQTHTDYQGDFYLKINKALRAGQYLITATFKGAHLLAPTSDTILIQILPATVQIQTVPAIQGITFQMDGRQFVSGPDGLASIDILQAGQYRLEVLLNQYHNSSQQVEFGRWSSGTYQPFRDVDVPSDGVVQVGLNVFHKVSFKFIDLDSYPIEPGRITSISIRSVQGDVFTLQPGDTPWLPASRTARRLSGLEETDLLYSVNSVIIDGSNVVNSAQQRFYAQPDDSWTITLLLFSLQINARDGLFASPIAKSINLSFPDGQVKNYALNQSGNIAIHALARGIYHISLVGVRGLGTTTPVALSRNQVVKMRVVTELDIGISAMVALVLSIGLILYGRPQLIKNLFHKKHPVNSPMQWTPDNENKVKTSN